MATVNETFGDVYWINLDRRPDLRQQMEAELAKHHIAATRVPGFDMQDQPGLFNYVRSRGHIGCGLAHFTALTLAAYRDLPSVLILEDDAVFYPGFAENFDKAMADLPDDWDIFYLGAWTGLPDQHNTVRITDRIHRMGFGLWTHAYAVRYRVYDIVLQEMATTRDAVDQVIARLMHDLNVYVAIPPLATQSHHYSETDYQTSTRVMM